MRAVELVGVGIRLRSWRRSDAPAVRRALREPAIALWNPQPGGPDVDLRVAEEWVRRRADWAEGSHVSMAVEDGETGELAGSVSLHRIDLRQGDAAIGYWTLPESRGRGIATRAVVAMTEWAFAALDLHRIELCHAAPNSASCRVAQLAGYPLEGTLRQSYRYGDGRRYDEHLHAKLATDP